jgi:mevalonate kinase
MARGTGHGKAILVGEHHVMTGATALAVGLPAFCTTVTLQPSPLQDATTLIDWPDGAELAEDVRADTLQMIAQACSLAGWQGAAQLAITSTIPIRRGLGSSAALAVAAVRAAQGLVGAGECLDLLAHARAVECVVHGRSSGLDPAAAAGDGAVLFRDGEILARVPIHPSLAGARWLLLDLGAGVPTREAIAIAQLHREQLGTAAVADLTATVSAAAQAAAQALGTGDLGALAAALNRAGAAMTPLGVVDSPMRHVLSLAAQAGALAAKQTGAGLGGMLLALVADAATAQGVLDRVAPHIRGHWQLPVATLQIVGD